MAVVERQAGNLSKYFLMWSSGHLAEYHSESLQPLFSSSSSTLSGHVRYSSNEEPEMKLTSTNRKNDLDEDEELRLSRLLLTQMLKLWALLTSWKNRLNWNV